MGTKAQKEEGKEEKKVILKLTPEEVDQVLCCIEFTEEQYAISGATAGLGKRIDKEAKVQRGEKWRTIVGEKNRSNIAGRGT